MSEQQSTELSHAQRKLELAEILKAHIDEQTSVESAHAAYFSGRVTYWQQEVKRLESKE